MPKSRVVIYREEGGSAPFVEWFKGLPNHAKDNVLVRIERLRDLGMSCEGPRLISCATESMNCAPRPVAFTIACCISFTGKSLP